VLRDKLALRETRRRISVQGYLIIPILLFSVVAERCLCKRKLRVTPTRMQASLNKPSDVLFARTSCSLGFSCVSREHCLLELLCLHSALDLVSMCGRCVCAVTVMYLCRDVALSFPSVEHWSLGHTSFSATVAILLINVSLSHHLAPISDLSR
jgi:hypothetical protein